MVEVGAPSSLDPQRASDAWAIRLFDALRRQVFAIRPDTWPAPHLAPAWRFALPTLRRLDRDPRAAFKDATAITPNTVATVAANPRAPADPACGIDDAALTGILAVEGINWHPPALIPRAPDPGLVQRSRLPILYPHVATAPRINGPRSLGPYRLDGRPHSVTLRPKATGTAPAAALPKVLVWALPKALEAGGGRPGAERRCRRGFGVAWPSRRFWRSTDAPAGTSAI